MERFFHSVYLDDEACRGCINCIKRCPTQPIAFCKRYSFMLQKDTYCIVKDALLHRNMWHIIFR